MIHSLTELDAEPERLGQVEPGCTDPANQIPPLHQFENHVWLAVKDLDRVGLHDVGVLAKLDPEPALGGEPRTADLVAQELVLQGLERDNRPPGFAQMVVDHVDQAHSTFVDVEDLEPVTDPISHLPNARHGRIPRSGFHCPVQGQCILPVLLYVWLGLWFEAGGIAEEKIMRNVRVETDRGPRCALPASAHLPVQGGETVEAVRQASQDDIRVVAKANLLHDPP